MSSYYVSDSVDDIKFEGKKTKNKVPLSSCRSNILNLILKNKLFEKVSKCLYFKSDTEF